MSECCICFENVDDDNGCSTCSCVFHENCIRFMYLENEHYSGCPVCRCELPPDEERDKISTFYDLCNFICELPFSCRLCSLLGVWVIANLDIQIQQ